MKKIFTLLVIIVLYVTVFAQSPQKFSFQAVIRNSSGQLVSVHSVRIRVSILQGSATGPAVYVETHATSTNANGLATIEIGGGTVVSGTFTGIDWSAGKYFIKTETDPAGGTNYTIERTSQLVSVPYALHATTAESIISETDPVFSAWDKDYGDLTHRPVNATTSSDGFMSAADKAKLNGLQNADGSETKITAGTNITVSGNGIGSNPYVINAKTYQAGDLAYGGIVFWVDGTGKHGLVCAVGDQSDGVRWHGGTFGNTQAYGDGPYAGKTNTPIIIAATVAIGDDNSTYAARICNELQILQGMKIYGDWYLPSKDELHLMFLNKATINSTAVANGGNTFASAYYWSSTEYTANWAWVQGFGGDDTQAGLGKGGIYRVRAIRAF